MEVRRRLQNFPLKMVRKLGLIGSIAGDYQPGDWVQGLGHRTAEVTPDGQSLVFMSSQSLEAVGYPHGYPNEGLYEVYMYEAQGGQLFCVSCASNGAPAQENEQAKAGEDPTAGYLPVSWSNTYQPRWISEDGSRVFFDSVEPLVPQDTNGKQDVYEWERDGSGSCEEADGCVYLLSGGTGGSASWLLDASADGDDVFIISRSELVPGDTYDSSIYMTRAWAVCHRPYRRRAWAPAVGGPAGAADLRDTVERDLCGHRKLPRPQLACSRGPAQEPAEGQIADASARAGESAEGVQKQARAQVV